MKKGVKDSVIGHQTVTLKKGVEPPKTKTSGSAIDIQEIRDRVAAKAYELYVKRGCTHGHDAEDWFEAEQLVMSHVKPAGK